MNLSVKSNKKLYVKGGALFFSIFFSLLVFALFLALLFPYFVNLQYADIHNKHKTSQDYTLNTIINKKVAGEYGVSEPNLTQQQWGLYSILQQTGDNNKIWLTGNYLGEPPALYIMNQSQESVTASGSTKIVGDICVPNCKMTYDALCGDYFSGTIQPKGNNFKTSSSTFPYFNHSAINFFDTYLQKENTPFVNNGNATLMHYTIKVNSSFMGSTKLVRFSANAVVLTGEMVGNGIIASSGSVNINRNFRIEDGIVVARKIIVESGWRGRMQLFATDTIIVENGCNFQYPSGVAVLSQNGNPAYIQIGQNSVINGYLLQLGTEAGFGKSNMDILPNASVWGIVLAEGTVAPYGSIHGGLFTKRLLVQNSCGTYINYLHNVYINAQEVPTEIAWPLIFQSNEQVLLTQLH